MSQHQDEVASRRLSILSAAMKVFDARGYANATVEAVAERAGVAKGSIYNYFPSKQELFAQVFAKAIGGIEADVDQLLTAASSASERMSRLVDFWFERLEYNKKIGRLILECWATAAREGQTGKLTEMLNQLYATWRSRIGEIIRQGKESGEFAQHIDPSTSASLVMGLTDGIIVQMILAESLKVDEEFLVALKRAILTALTGKLQIPESNRRTATAKT